MSEQQIAAGGVVLESGTGTGQTFWHRYFKFYDTLNESATYRDMVANNVSLLGAGAGDHVLDAGTGTGNIAIELLGRGARVTGTDFTESALELCRQKAPTGTFVFADLSKPLPFDDETFEHAICINVVHLLDDESRALAMSEFHRVVKPGGRVVVTVFAEGFNTMSVYWETLRRHREQHGILETIGRGIRLFFTTLRIFYYVSQIPRNHSKRKFITEPELRAFMTGAGLKVRSIERTFAGQCWVGAAEK
jgi:ubiquinone/menaquinone biosynthesis C-methylase UbiE